MRVPRQPEKRFNLIGWIDGEAGKLLADRRRKLGAVARARRGNDEAGIRPSIDDELLAYVRPTVGLHRVRVEANVTIDDRPRCARNEQAVAVPLKFVNEHPEQWHHSPALLIGEGFQAAFPCRKNPD